MGGRLSIESGFQVVDIGCGRGTSSGLDRREGRDNGPSGITETRKAGVCPGVDDDDGALRRWEWEVRPEAMCWREELEGSERRTSNENSGESAGMERG